MNNDNYALIRDIGHRHVEALTAVVGESNAQEQAVAVTMHLALRELANVFAGQVESQRRIGDLRLRWYRVAYDSAAEARAELEELRRQHATLLMRYSTTLEDRDALAAQLLQVAAQLDSTTTEVTRLQGLIDGLLAGEDELPCTIGPSSISTSVATAPSEPVAVTTSRNGAGLPPPSISRGGGAGAPSAQTAERMPPGIDWRGLPADVLERVRDLDTGRGDWRRLPATDRRAIILYALPRLAGNGALTMTQYNAVRPEWMPTADAAIKFFSLRWSELLDSSIAHKGAD